MKSKEYNKILWKGKLDLNGDIGGQELPLFEKLTFKFLFEKWHLS